MSSSDIPTSTIKSQPHTTLSFVDDGTLVDDTVKLVDDTAALVGGPTTIVENLKPSLKLDRVYTKLPRNS